MTPQKENLVIQISTKNGTGSSTANNFLHKVILAAGYFASSKNLFPSNIAGLPTNYFLRINSRGFTGFSTQPDIYIGFNKEVLGKELEVLPKDTLVILNEDFKTTDEERTCIQIPVRKLSRDLHSSPSMRKLAGNMLYVGFISKVLGIELEIIQSMSQQEFKKGSQELIKLNQNALRIGWDFCMDTALEAISLTRPSSSPKHLIDGNSTLAMGFLDGGIQVCTWYPITPSTSVVESLDSFSSKFKAIEEQPKILQCEDEIASAMTALGAGWAGARAFTATSGPGLSLMQEAIGLGYFAECPFVIANVQRAGPSTGLPTRTSQGDVLLSHYSSHGDTLHPILLPGSPQELYEDAFTSLNLAERLRTPIIVLSDLDLGMNYWPTNQIIRTANEIERSDVKTKSSTDFKPYDFDVQNLERSLPLASDQDLSYFTRGSGHNEFGQYSEDPTDYESKLLRLKEKVFKNLNLFPEDRIELHPEAQSSLLCFGSTTQLLEELQTLLGQKYSVYVIRSLPLKKEKLDEFLKSHKNNFVLEQNRDGQLYKIIKSELSGVSNLKSICQFNGLPASPQHFKNEINSVTVP